MKKRRTESWLIGGVAMAALFLLTTHPLAPTHSPAQAAAAEPYFEGKRITIFVGFPPAGTHDLEARVVARHIGKYLPGNPTALVKNMPGAAGDIMISHLYGRVKPNGLTIGISGTAQKLSVPAGRKVAYDLSKMPLVWVVQGTNVHFVRDLLKAGSVRELLKIDPGEIVVAGRSAVDTSCANGRLAMDLLGIKGYKAVCRYPGTGPISAAMERGEATYFVGVSEMLVGGGAFAGMAERKVVIPLWQHGRITPEGNVVRSPTVTFDVPTLYDVYREVHGSPPTGLIWETALATGPKLDTLTRTYHLPPGTPGELVAVWRDAMVRVAKDPGFVSDWQRIIGPDVSAVIVPPDQAERIVAEFFTPAPWYKFFQKFVAALTR